MSALFLVQIPHSAGTTLRLAACRHWGSNHIVSDHGSGNRHTSSVVEELVYLEQDHHQFKEYLERENISLLTSSLPLNGLRRIFPASNLVTFVREPVERLIKAYQQTHTGKFNNTDFLKFCQKPENQNTQSRYLKELPLELYGFVGISERYSESLEMFNTAFNCELSELGSSPEATGSADLATTKPNSSVRKTKSNRSEQPALVAVLSNKTLKAVQDLNQKDLEIYKTANDLFETRLQTYQANASYIHGKVSHLTQDKVSGWAVSMHDHSPCKVRILVNKQCVAVTPAREYLSKLKERNVSRDGYVGFCVHFAEKLKPNDVVSCYIHPSDQLLAGPSKPTEK